MEYPSRVLKSGENHAGILDLSPAKAYSIFNIPARPIPVMGDAQDRRVFFVRTPKGRVIPLKYSKPALSFEAQVELLSSRGLTIDDPDSAREFLAYSNYYRFSAYFRPYEAEENRFIEGTSFSDIVDLYHFDRRLRQVLSQAIGAAEISFRTRIAYNLSMKHGPFCHLRRETFSKGFDKHWEDWHIRTLQETTRSREPFIDHFRSNYDEYPNLPIWATTEIMTFGSLSKMYKTLKDQEKSEIARNFGLHRDILESWMHCLSYIRNLCAHHSRIWNKVLGIKPRIPKKDTRWEGVDNSRIFSIFLLINQLLFSCSGITDLIREWHQSVDSLFDTLPQVSNLHQSMGMPNNWKEHPLWKH